MIAEAVDLVPDLFESAGPSTSHTNNQGRREICEVSVYASWKRKHEELKPHVYVTLQQLPFSIGLNLQPEDARELAANLVRGAVLAEATQAALDEELQKVS